MAELESKQDDGELIDEFDPLANSIYFLRDPELFDTLITNIQSCTTSLPHNLTVLSGLIIKNIEIKNYPLDLFNYKLDKIKNFIKTGKYYGLKDKNSILFLTLLLVIFNINLQYDEEIEEPMIEIDRDDAMIKLSSEHRGKKADEKAAIKEKLTVKSIRLVDLTDSLAPILNIYAFKYSKILSDDTSFPLSESQHFTITDDKIIDLILRNNQELFASKNLINAEFNILLKKFKASKPYIYAKDNSCAISKKYLLNNKNPDYYTKYAYNFESIKNQNFYQKYLSYKKKYIKLKLKYI